MTVKEKYDDTAEVKEAVKKLPDTVKAEIAKDFATYEMIYRFGYNDGFNARTGAA